MVITAAEEEGFRFESAAGQQVIRLVFPAGADRPGPSLKIKVRLRIQLELGAATHLSLVDGRVRQGRIIDLATSWGESFELFGIFDHFDGEALLVLVLEGPARGQVLLDEITVSPSMAERNFAVLCFIEPWIDRDDALWREPHISWFGAVASALMQANPACRLHLLCNGALLESPEITALPMPVGSITQEALLRIFPSFRAAMNHWAREDQATPEAARMGDLVRAALGDFEPDIILATAPAPYLRLLFPKALVLHIDGLYFRPPWPDSTPILDPVGCLQGAILPDMARQIERDTGSSLFIERYRSIVDRRSAPSAEQVATEVARYRGNFDRLVVLALQDLRHQNAFLVQPHLTQIDYIHAAMTRIPANIGVILAQHPDRRGIDERTLNWLERKFPNLLRNAHFDQLSAPTQALLPFVDGLVTTSSGVIYQAALRRKPAFLTHRSSFSSLAHARDLDDIGLSSAFVVDHESVDTQMAWLLRHHAIPHAFLLHTGWLHDRLAWLAEVHRAGALSWRSLPRLAGDATILHWLEKTLLPPAA